MSDKIETDIPMATVIGFEIDTNYKEKLFNFCQDFDIVNVTDDDLMVCLIKVLDETYEIPSNLNTGRMNMSDFWVFSETLDNGKEALMVEFISPEAEKLYHEAVKEFGEHHDPDFSFIISYDYEGDHDMNGLTYEFNRYFSTIAASKNINGYYSDKELNSFMFGTRDEV